MPRFYTRPPAPKPGKGVRFTKGKGYYYGAPVPKKKAPPKPPSLATQQLTEAKTIAAASINPAVAEINMAIAAAEVARKNQARAAEGITRALGELSAGDAEASREAYAAAADRIGQYGQAFTGQLRGLQEGAAATANEGIARIVDAPPVTSQADANANVTAMTGMAIPGELLATEAARARDAAANRRLAGGLRIADQYGIADYKAGQGIQEIRSEIAKLEAKRPALIMDALGDIRQQANAQRATDTQIGYLQLQQAKTVRDEAIAMTNLTGQLHIVMGTGKKARVVNTGRPAMGSDAAVAQVEAETSRQNAAARERAAANTAAARERSARIAAQAKKDAAQIAANAKVAAAKTAQGKSAVSNAKTAASAQQKFIAEATKYARQVAGVIPKTGRPRQMPPSRVSIMRAIERTWGSTLVGKFGITKQDVAKWANAIVMAMPNSWWQQSSYGAATTGGSGKGSSGYTAGG